MSLFLLIRTPDTIKWKLKKKRLKKWLREIKKERGKKGLTIASAQIYISSPFNRDEEKTCALLYSSEIISK